MPIARAFFEVTPRLADSALATLQHLVIIESFKIKRSERGLIGFDVFYRAHNEQQREMIRRRIEDSLLSSLKEVGNPIFNVT